MKDVCMSRTFDLVDTKARPIKEVELLVYMPYQETNNEWRCDYQILNLDDDKQYTVLGVDSLQALLLTLQIVDLRLQTYNNKNTSKIIWLDTHQNDFGLINKKHEI